MIKRFSILTFAFAALLFTSCSDIIDGITGDRDGLQVEVDDSTGYTGTGTRAAYSDIIHTDFEAGDAIGVYAYDTDGDLISSNVKFTKQSDGSWTSDANVVFNPDYKYYGYFPYNSDAYTPASGDDVDTKFADFIVDKDNKFWKKDQSVKANYDASNLMIALGVNGGDRTIKFHMQHKRGLAVISGAQNKWYYSSDPNKLLATTVTVVPTKADSVGNFTYTDNTNSYFLTKPDTATNIGGLNWKVAAGKYMMYTGAMLTGEPKSYEYSTSTDGGNNWSDFSATRPACLSDIESHTTEGSATNFSVTPSTTKTTDIVVAGPDKDLQANTTVSNVDLSMVNNDGSARASRTTANCYLVHAAGTYRLPLVYGNAIKNGATNRSAYYTTNSPDSYVSILGNFLNSNGNGIYTGDDEKDPWIESHNISVAKAELVWQDVKGLIKTVGIEGNGDERYLTFEVSKDNIAEGNAVIAAETADGTVVWSWHIWVTGQTLEANECTPITTDKCTYNVAPVNIGYSAATYIGSQCRVRAIGANGLTVQFQLQQPNAKSDKTNTLINTYYQWGRKDPFPSSSRSLYDINGNSIALSVNRESKIHGVDFYIQHPGIFYTDMPGYSESPYDLDYTNLWDADEAASYESPTKPIENASGSTTKSVYDPCPPDYCVPKGYLYEYIGYREGNDNNNESSWALSGQSLIRVGTTPVLYYPLVGAIYGDDNPGYWSATAHYFDRGFYGSVILRVSNSLLDNISYAQIGINVMQSGNPVRPVRE